MARCACALALLCAIVVGVGVAAYTVDCNHEYTDCDTELSKITSEDDDTASTLLPVALTNKHASSTETTSTTTAPTTAEENYENKTGIQITTEANEVTEPMPKPKPRLLNLSVDELQNFANALHNQTKGIKKTLDDLSDVNLDEDEEDNPRNYAHEARTKQISDKFYANLQTPFNPLLTIDKSEEIETCKENGVIYKIGDHVDRGCDESCECSPGGVFECASRCKHPFIRRGKRLNDPLCFESPVDECCSIVTCVTGNGEPKQTILDVCTYYNETYTVGETWHIGCKQTCSCEPKSIVTCKPRCKPLPQSDKCINVQDPKDECCEMQICDVSQDVHEEPADLNNSSSTTVMPKKSQDLVSPPRPLVLTEPIGSVKVLQNNTVQVNLMHINNSEDPIHLLLSSDGGNTYNDIELKYSNLILNLEGGKDYILKTKETGTKFNFTVTASDFGNEVEESVNGGKNGCYHDEKLYAIGEEFQIGCKELCECTGRDKRECAPLQCPTHVGLELLSRGCVLWAPSPPATPPNCCPRTARCLSDGTCHYKGQAIPNWSEVPISLTGCEEHCFCENGSLDCQPACVPLPDLPPQYLRCPLLHHPGPVNASHDDCCKVWGCVPNAGNMYANTTIMPTSSHTMKYVTPIAPIIPTITSFLPTPPQTTKITQFYERLNPIKTIPKFFKTVNPQHILNYTFKGVIDNYSDNIHDNNITVFTPEDIDSPFKTIQPEPPFVSNTVDWRAVMNSNGPILPNPFYNIHLNRSASSHDVHSQNSKPFNIVISDGKLHDIIQASKYDNGIKPPTLSSHDLFVKQMDDSQSVKKMPLSQFNDINYFHPFYDKSTIANNLQNSNQIYFEPTKVHDKTTKIPTFDTKGLQIIHNNPEKHVTLLKNKDLKSIRPTITKSNIMTKNMQTHLLAKEPNPYETVLLRLLPNTKPSMKLIFDPTLHIPKVPKPYSSLDLEHLLNQMELESETNKNLGRSADKSHSTIAAGQTPQGSENLPPPTLPSFLPTIPTDEHYPPEEPELPGISGLSNYGGSDDNKKLSVLSLQGDSPTSIKMLFGLPPVLVGLRGSVDLRYTDSAEEDISQWYSQVFAPADEILTTPRLEFRLTGLKPSTTYKIRGKLYLHNLPVEPESEIYTVKTQDAPSVTSPEGKRREIDCKLTLEEVNDTIARVTWRHFNEDELQFIDGIQVRYRQTGTPIYSMTELLHHSRQGALLQELRAGSRYEASLILVPPPRATIELFDPNTVEFTTAPYIDPYNWTVTVEVNSVGSEAAELTWRGIPNPPERWVRVFRAAHACGKLRKEHDSFRLAARNEPNVITLTGLEPDARCRVWLELFLSNGKVKTSNVLEIHTKSLDSPEPIDNVIEASSISGSRGPPRGDYYGALVAVGVIAALAALAAVLLLLVVVRRHRPRSVAITSVPSAPRESSLPPYDNPAYKLELQQETMDL